MRRLIMGSILVARLPAAAVMLLLLLVVVAHAERHPLEVKFDHLQPLSRIGLHRQLTAISPSVKISASPEVLGADGSTYAYVTVTFNKSKDAAATDWIGVFSPANFNGSQCLADLNLTNNDDTPPYLCSSPIKFQYANYSSTNYVSTGKGSLTFRLINQRYNFAFGFFSGDLTNPVLEAVSNTISFKNPNAPVWPRLALGKEWDTITVTWTSGYSQSVAKPIVLWKSEDDTTWTTTPAVTLTFSKADMCGPPASTIGYRDPGFTHTGFLKNLGPDTTYYYKVGHKLKNGQYVWDIQRYFQSPPFPGEDSVQKIIIFGDMGKFERDGSNEYYNTQPGALLTTDQLVKELDDIDIVFHNGDIVYANGYIFEWEQYIEQVNNISSRVPWMLTSGNHERDWPGTGSFYVTTDSGGECGVVYSTSHAMPATKDKEWYSLDYGMFHFCVGASEEDWREGTEQWNFLDKCLGSADRSKQPWLIFLAHRVLGYSTGAEYQVIGSFGEPMAHDSLQKLWQLHKVDLAFYGHVHTYERTCPIYENNCVGTETQNFAGTFNATIHIVSGNGGRGLDTPGLLNTTWSLVRDYANYGFMKLTASDHQNLLVEYKLSKDGSVFDSFTISREYTDVLGCDNTNTRNCPESTDADL
ncbi:hypothetical protein CY35_09G005100 [Sphagnum magellanicum]|nr:hypothetical protein CY35_09G005100 [Sphagnum magellanicum]KAH9551243.1 hypothetical protein CY35_09G005100 [Sphagnum magellanicum]